MSGPDRAQARPERAAEPAAHGPTLRLQRQCACGAKTSGLASDCEACREKKLVGGQAKLAIGASDDRFEREADRIAEQVMAGRPHESGEAAPVQVQRVDSAGGGGSLGHAPDEVQHVIDAPARGLDAATRGFLEPRFGHDFSRVRVHDDAEADRSARAVGARAYTVGQELVFAAGEYRPHTDAGRRLLAHELTHVMQQQQGGPARVQREDKKSDAPKPAGKTDVAIVLSEDDQDMAEGRAYAKTVIRVTDVADAAAKLKALGVPIGRLYVVSHSNNVGELQFISGIGTISWVPMRDLGSALKGQVSIDDLDFRGCKIGEASGALEATRSRAGAKTASGSNCWTFTQRAPPITFDGVDITQPSQIPEGKQAQFDAALLKQLGGMTADNGTAVSQCLLGLGKGERPNKKILAKLWALYWANNGNMIATWASPEFNKNWQKGSICTKDMTEATKPCGLVQVSAAAATTGTKTGALEDSGQDSEFADATRAEDGPRPEDEVA